MTSYFHIFGKSRCKFCTKAVKLLKAKKLDYVVSNMENAPTALEELKSANDWKTVPIVFEIVGTKFNFVGGYSELKGYLNGTKEEKGRGEGTDLLRTDTV